MMPSTLVMDFMIATCGGNPEAIAVQFPIEMARKQGYVWRVPTKFNGAWHAQYLKRWYPLQGRLQCPGMPGYIFVAGPEIAVADLPAWLQKKMEVKHVPI